MREFLMALPFILLAITYVLSYIYDNLFPQRNYTPKTKTIITTIMLSLGVLALISTILIYVVFDIA